VLIEKIIEQPATLLTLLTCPEYKDKMVFIDLTGELPMDAAVPCLMLWQSLRAMTRALVYHN
jgi:hypothetical protein